MRNPSAAVEKQEEGHSLHHEIVRPRAKAFGVHQHAAIRKCFSRNFN